MSYLDWLYLHDHFFSLTLFPQPNRPSWVTSVMYKKNLGNWGWQGGGQHAVSVASGPHVSDSTLSHIFWIGKTIAGFSKTRFKTGFQWIYPDFCDSQFTITSRNVIHITGFYILYWCQEGLAGGLDVACLSFGSAIVPPGSWQLFLICGPFYLHNCLSVGE